MGLQAAEQILWYKAKIKKPRWILDEVLQLSGRHKKLQKNKKEGVNLRDEYSRLTREINSK